MSMKIVSVRSADVAAARTLLRCSRHRVRVSVALYLSLALR